MENFNTKKVAYLLITITVSILLPITLYGLVFGGFYDLDVQGLTEVIKTTKAPHFLLLILQPLGLLSLIPLAVLITRKLIEDNSYNLAFASVISAILVTITYTIPQFVYIIIKYKYAIEVVVQNTPFEHFAKTPTAKLIPDILVIIDTILVDELGYFFFNIFTLTICISLYRILKDKVIYYSGLMVTGLKFLMFLTNFILWELREILAGTKEVISILLIMWFAFTGIWIIFSTRKKLHFK